MGGRGARKRRRAKRYHLRPETYKWYQLTFWLIRYGQLKHKWHNFKNKFNTRQSRRRWANHVKASIAGCPTRYVRAGTVPIDVVLPLIRKEVSARLCGKNVRFTSRRYKCYKLRGTTCVSCGLKGHYFAVEKHRYWHQKDVSNPYHLNLYHKRKDGVEVMLTVDHIIPLAQNGSDSVKNLQPMCRPCNSRKGSKLPKGYRKYPGMVKTTDPKSFVPKKKKPCRLRRKKRREGLQKIIVDESQILV